MMENTSTERSSKPGRTGLKRIGFAFYYSFLGFKAAWTNEAAFRQEMAAFILLVPTAFWLGQTLEQRILLLIPCFIVLITELLNSSIEAAIDRIGPEKHALSGQAKDIASTAVFISLSFFFLVWGMVAWQRFVG